MNLKKLIQPGDIFLIDSNRTGAKIVKFFQTAPTWVQYLWRKFRKTQETVLFYHVGMIYDSNNIIEQQWKVIKRDNGKILNSRNRLFIARRKDISEEKQRALQLVSLDDLGQGYDVLNIIGKTLSWLTGIPIFGQYLQWPNAEVCVNRVSAWYKEVFGETFGNKTHSDVTTHEMYKWIKTHPDKWEVVFERFPREEK